MAGLRAAATVALLSVAGAQFHQPFSIPRLSPLPSLHLFPQPSPQPITFPEFPFFTTPPPFPGSGGQSNQRDQQLTPNCGKIQRAAPKRMTASEGLNQAFVVGGQDAIDGDWPWLVLLGERHRGRLRWTCGGTLLSDRIVLTAAHCVVGRQPSALVARLGEFDTSRNDGGSVDMTVARIVVHQGYRPPQRHDDIALLHLSQPAALGRRVQPACLPPAGSDHTGRSARVAGWGVTEFNGETSAVLQEATLKVVDVQQCERSYQQRGQRFDSAFPGGFRGTKLCASEHEKDACDGDSGGPLVVTGRDQRTQVIGVVSLGEGCGIPDFPGIYTKVSQYIPWIMRNAR